MRGKKQTTDLKTFLGQIMTAHAWSQADLADEIEMRQSDISKMQYSPLWNQHFKVFMKLIELRGEA